jgi:hypothetical protein
VKKLPQLRNLLPTLLLLVRPSHPATRLQIWLAKPEREQINTARFSAADLIIFVDLPKPKPGE